MGIWQKGLGSCARWWNIEIKVNATQVSAHLGHPVQKLSFSYVYQIFQGILALLTPDWSHISAPWVWLEAIRIVFISLQLGLGVVSTLASYNKYHHNIIRSDICKLSFRKVQLHLTPEIEVSRMLYLRDVILKIEIDIFIRQHINYNASISGENSVGPPCRGGQNSSFICHYSDNRIL